VTPDPTGSGAALGLRGSDRQVAAPLRSRVREPRIDGRDDAGTAPPAATADELYVALAPAVLGYLRASGTPEPEDVLGDVFLQVARDLPGFRGDAAAQRRWVFSIAHNRMVDDARRRRRRPMRLVATVPEQPSYDASGFDPALVDALGALTRDQRNVVVLRFVADLSIMDTARILHRPPGVVKALQHRGLRRLAVELSR